MQSNRDANLSIVAENAICYVPPRMILNQMASGLKKRGLQAAIALAVLGLAACTPVDDTIGSRLTQPPAGTPKPKPVEAGDIAIVGQEVAHSIVELPAVSGASNPPLVQFNGVTSIIDKPIDTDPYTELLRDRLLLLTRTKLRFVEHTLPPYVPPSKKKKAAPQPHQNTSDPDFQILAELRGHAEDEFYRIQIEFRDAHSGEVLFNQVYRIRKEASDQAPVPSGNQVPPPPADETPESTGASGKVTL